MYQDVVSPAEDAYASAASSVNLRQEPPTHIINMNTRRNNSGPASGVTPAETLAAVNAATQGTSYNITVMQKVPRKLRVTRRVCDVLACAAYNPERAPHWGARTP
jgi:hypothetical protein